MSLGPRVETGAGFWSLAPNPSQSEICREGADGPEPEGPVAGMGWGQAAGAWMKLAGNDSPRATGRQALLDT
jgi:hypothetical protein